MLKAKEGGCLKISQFSAQAISRFNTLSDILAAQTKNILSAWRVGQHGCPPNNRNRAGNIVGDQMKTIQVISFPLLLLVGQLANAADFFVNKADFDLPDNNVADNVCNDGTGGDPLPCSLRAAVMQANATPGPDTIWLPSNLGDYRLTRNDDDDDAFKGDLDITDDVTIQNFTSAGATIDGRHQDRIFHVVGAHTLTLTGINLINGVADANTNNEGGAILVEGGTLNATRLTITNNIAYRGGGINIENGSLNIVDAYFHRNALSDRDFAGLARGSAIYADGSDLYIANTTFSENVSPSNNSTNVPITQESSSVDFFDSVVEIENSTIFGNYNGINTNLGNMGNSLEMNHVTVANNSNIGLRNFQAAVLTVDRSLIANNGTDCLMSVGGVRILERSGSTDSSCDLVSNTNIENMLDPVLTSLLDWGGFAPTLMLTEDSEAIDTISACDNALTEDQRGEDRRINGDDDAFAFCDMGAVEYNPISDLNVIFNDRFVEPE
jgi:hypothetical protein